MSQQRGGASKVQRTSKGPYDILVHRHRFAAWAASRAASVKGCRFSAEQGSTILDRAKIRSLIASADSLPKPDSKSVDIEHKKWCVRVIRVALEDYQLPFTHGVAAKLVNMYLKASFVCGGQHDHERVCQLHPPIDSLLLESLCVNEIGGPSKTAVWREMRDKRWSKFTGEDYQAVISAIRMVVGEKPLWTIEEHWRGYR